MSTKARRNTASVGFVATAIVLALTSVASACTIYAGKVTVTDAAGRTSQSIGDGITGTHGYCSNPTGNAQSPALGQVTISVAPGTCSGVSYALPDGVYNLAFYNGASYSGGSTSWTADPSKVCGPNNVGAGVARPLPEKLVVNSVIGSPGTGSVTVTLPALLAANASGTASALCVNPEIATTTPSSGRGGQVPIIIV